MENLINVFNQEEIELIINFKENKYINKYRKLNNISLRRLRRNVMNQVKLEGEN